MIVTDLPNDALDVGICALDTETDTSINGLDHRVSRPLCIQYASEVGEYLVPLQKGFLPANVRKLLEDKNMYKVFHHAQFDCTMLQYNYGVQIGNLACTRILAQVIDPHKKRFTSHSLQSLLDQVLGVRLLKDHRIRVSDWSVLSDEQIAYAMLDVRYLIQLHDTLIAETTIAEEDEYVTAVEQLPSYVNLKCLPYDVLRLYEYSK